MLGCGGGVGGETFIRGGFRISASEGRVFEIQKGEKVHVCVNLLKAYLKVHILRSIDRTSGFRARRTKPRVGVD